MVLKIGYIERVYLLTHRYVGNETALHLDSENAKHIPDFLPSHLMYFFT